MHIHGGMSNRLSVFIPTQSAQQTIAARKAASEVRKKLTGLATICDSYAVSYVYAHAEGDRGRRQDAPKDEEAFRHVFVSIDA